VFTIRVGGVGDVFSVETKKTPLFTSIQLPFFTSSLLPDRLSCGLRDRVAYSKLLVRFLTRSILAKTQ